MNREPLTVNRTILTEVIGQDIADITPLSGGCIGQVYRVRLANGQQLVLKADDGPAPRLDIEAYMLRYLAAHSPLPVPEVRYAAPNLLVMAYMPGDSRFSAAAQAHAAELLAALHAISAPAYGLERDTLIGGLHQPNEWHPGWLTFFREMRLLYMGQEAARVGRLPAELMRRLERFCARLNEWLLEPERPSLLHGDVWTTNVLGQNGRITAFLDPAIYYGHAEIELAFITLFDTFAQPFFARYQELRPIDPGFWQQRRDIYNLYPLLVHVRLFGGSYVSAVAQALRRFGF